MRATFTSTSGGKALQAQVLASIAEAQTIKGDRVDLQIMCFALTDRTVAEALLRLAWQNPLLKVRVIADWSQSAPNSPSQLRFMSANGPPNLFVKFKLDLPYDRAADGRLRYSYRASFGMLHHKSLCIVADGQPRVLTIGSMNWSNRGTESYENLLRLDATDDPAEHAVRGAFHAEFEALWNSHALTATPTRADLILAHFRAEAGDGSASQMSLVKHFFGTDPQRDLPTEGKRTLAAGSAVVAFSGRVPGADRARAGFSDRNDRRAIALLRPSGQRRPAPLTLTTLSLEAIRSAPNGERSLLAMYAFSPRHPAFGAILSQARAGSQFRILLDGKLGKATVAALKRISADEALPIEIKSTRRRMHQKYFCCPSIGLVLTGTANMTIDAVERHADHALLIRSDMDLAHDFAEDFETIWNRLPDRAADGAAAGSAPGRARA